VLNFCATVSRRVQKDDVPIARTRPDTDAHAAIDNVRREAEVCPPAARNILGRSGKILEWPLRQAPPWMKTKTARPPVFGDESPGGETS
jgi:hypothetical protein